MSLVESRVRRFLIAPRGYLVILDEETGFCAPNPRHEHDDSTREQHS
jgi:hypothetical protein